MYQIHYFDSVETDKIEFQSPKKVQNRYRSTARYNKDKLLVQSPRVRGLCNDDGQLDITIEENKAFLDFLVSIDELCVKTAESNSQVWFGRKLSYDIVRKSYRSPLSVGRNGAHLMAKLQYDEYGEVATRVFDEYANEISLEDVSDNCDCAIILELSGFWFGKTAMRCEWSVVQIKLYNDENATVELQVDSETEEENTFFTPDEIIYDEDES